MTVMDQIAEAVGYTAATTVAVVFAGRDLWVPTRVAGDHPLVALIGLRPFRSLVDRYGGERLRIPEWSTVEALRRDWRIAQSLADGTDTGAIAQREGLTTRRIEQIRAELVLRGWLQYAEGPRPGKRGKILGTGEVFQRPPPPEERAA